MTSVHASISSAAKLDGSPKVARGCAESFSRAEELLKHDLPYNTKRAYRQALRALCLWYRARFEDTLPMPLSASVVQQFLFDFLAHRVGQADGTQVWGCALPNEIDELLVKARVKRRRGPWALNTLETRLAAISAVHEWHGFCSPTELPEVRSLWKMLREQQLEAEDKYVRPFLPRRTKLVNVADIRRMLDACDNTLTGIRDRALIAFTFSAGGRLREEVAATTVESLERLVDEQGHTHFRFTLRRSHTEPGQPINSSVKPIFGMAANYLDAWLEASNIREGALWRRIQMGRATTPLSSRAIFDIVSKRASQIGLLNVNPRSLRAGFVTAAAERELPTFSVMAMSGHKSVSDAFRFYRIETAECRKLDGLLDDTGLPDPPPDPAGQ